MTAQTPPTRRHRARRKLSPKGGLAFPIADLQRIEEWRHGPRVTPIQTWLALDGVRTHEVLCVNLSTADRVARWTVAPDRGGRVRLAQVSPQRRSWLLESVDDALEALEIAVAFCVETA